MNEHPAAVVAQFDPISLAEMDRNAALQTRHDNKYFLAWPLFEEFTRSLRDDYLALDIRGIRVFDYDTLYFDTASLGLYRAHLQGRRRRFKTRSRYYVDSDLCFFEVKLKGRRGETVKTKMAYDRASFGTVTAEARAFLQESLSGSYGMQFADPLAPALGTHYRRATLVAKATEERITCDFDLAFADAHGATAGIQDRYVLIEVKSARGSGETDRSLWRMGARPVSGSKYCTGIGLLRPETRSNRFLPQMRRYFGWSSPPPRDDWVVGADRDGALDGMARPSPAISEPLVSVDLRQAIVPLLTPQRVEHPRR